MEYTQEEIERVWEEQKAKVRWEIMRGRDKDFIFEVAKLKGWLDNPPKIQVRLILEPQFDGSKVEYYAIEPYEEDCNCPNIVPPPVEHEG